MSLSSNRSGSGESAAPTLLVVLGCTGTGKSELALELAQHLAGEIIGCDALQVYRDFDAGTAKPTAEERSLVPHHLVDHVDPRVDYSLADYVREANQVIGEVARRGGVPLVVGGTGMYLRGLLRGVVDAPPRNAALRARLQRVAERRGTPTLHRWLTRLDPESAARLPAQDRQRIVRALELALGGEQTWSERLQRQGSWDSGIERHRSLKIGLELPRELLVRRLDARVERFFESGWVEEVRGLLSSGVPRPANAFKAIGYRDIVSALEQGADPQATGDEIKRNTRRYAKRQRTWFRKERDVIWLDGTLALARQVEYVLDLWSRARRGERVLYSPALQEPQGG